MSMLLDPIDPHQVTRAKLLLEELPKWLGSLSPEEIKNQMYDSALDALDKAIIETRRYIRHRIEGGDRDGEIERRLSDLWLDACKEIQPYDGHVASLCSVKANGWADETTWDAPENRDLPIRVDQMLKHSRRLRENPPYNAPQWEKIVAVGMAVLIIGVVLYLVVRNQPFADPNLVTVLRIVLSVAAGILGATIPGFLNVQWRGEGFLIRAGGALALFAITYFGSPNVILSHQVIQPEFLNQQERRNLPDTPFLIDLEVMLPMLVQGKQFGFWVAYQSKQGNTISPVHLALYAQFVNLQSKAVSITKLTAEFRSGEDNWQSLLPIDTNGRTLYFPFEGLHKAAKVTLSAGDLLDIFRTRQIQPNETVRGWLFFEASENSKNCLASKECKATQFRFHLADSAKSEIVTVVDAPKGDPNTISHAGFELSKVEDLSGYHITDYNESLSSMPTSSATPYIHTTESDLRNTRSRRSTGDQEKRAAVPANINRERVVPANANKVREILNANR